MHTEWISQIDCYLASQSSELEQLQESLEEYGVKLDIQYSDTLHDRKIRLPSVWKQTLLWMN